MVSKAACVGENGGSGTGLPGESRLCNGKKFKSEGGSRKEQCLEQGKAAEKKKEELRIEK